MSGDKIRLESPLLSWPNEWGKQRPANKLILALIVFGIGAVIAVPYTISYASSGDSLRASYGIAGGLVALTFIAILLPHTRTRRKEIPLGLYSNYRDGTRTGLHIPYLASWKPILAMWLIVGAAFLVLRGFLFAAHLSGSDDSGRSTIDVGGLVVVIVALTLTALMIRYLLSGKNRRGFVSLSDKGVSHSLGSTSRFIPWTDIARVSPCIINNSLTVRITPAPGAKIRVDSGRSLIDRLQRSFFEQNMDLHAWVLGIDPALLLYVVQF